jgi:hypothetical protein
MLNISAPYVGPRMRRATFVPRASVATAAAMVAACRSETTTPWGSSGSGTYKFDDSSDSAEAKYKKLGHKDQYESTTFTTSKAQTKVVCRQKPLVQSRIEKLWAFFRPKSSTGERDMLEPLQLFKVLGYLAYPVAALIWWKKVYAKYPDKWEEQFSNLQARPNREKDTTAKQESYFDVIDKLEQKRASAMERKGHTSPTTGQAPAPEPAAAV